MSLFAVLFALAAVAQADAPPPAAVALLSAVESGDVNGARAVLAEEAMIADSSSGTGQESSLPALFDYGRGCTRSNLTWDHDPTEPENAVVSLTWSCPSRAPSQTVVWTEGARVAWVQFGLPDPETWLPLPNRETPQ